MERVNYDMRRPQAYIDNTPTIDTIGISNRILEMVTDTLVDNEMTTSEAVNNGTWLRNKDDIAKLGNAIQYQIDLVFAALGYHTRNPERWEPESKYPEYRL